MNIPGRLNKIEFLQISYIKKKRKKKVYTKKKKIMLLF